MSWEKRLLGGGMKTSDNIHDSIDNVNKKDDVDDSKTSEEDSLLSSSSLNNNEDDVETHLASKISRIQHLSTDDVYIKMGTNPNNGLTSEEALNRLDMYGQNKISQRPKPHILWRLLSHFTHLMALLLWFAGILAMIGDSVTMGIAIWMVNILNGSFSFYQEFQADKAAEALKQLLPIHCRTLRDGKQQLLNAELLVPGDIILIEEGERLSADCRVVEGTDLMMDQSTFTGESVTRAKTSDPVDFTPEEVAKTRTMFRNLIFCGTSVVGGSAKAVVLTTGMRTEFGQIAQKTLDVEEGESPLQKEMREATKTISVIALSIGILIFVTTHTLVNISLRHSAIFAIGMAVAFIPEGLLPLVTLSLARASLRMAARGAIVKKLSAVETLGCTSAICTDKTGTLTLNEMSVANVWMASTNSMLNVSGDGYEPKGAISLDQKNPSNQEQVSRMFLGFNLCNNATLVPPKSINHSWTILGDPTEAALLCVAAKHGRVKKEDEDSYPRIGQVSFSSVRKRMSTIHKSVKDNSQILVMKGAPNVVLSLSKYVLTSNGEKIELTNEHREHIRLAEEFMAKQGQRVLGFAERDVSGMDVSGKPDENIVENDLTFLGLAGMFDPPRENVPQAISDCHRAGIRVIMITGDNATTAASIAEQIGMRKTKRIDKIKTIDGSELKAMADDELITLLEETQDVVFARTLPQDKMKVVAMLQELGHVVAVTGDGVNDAPALKKSDIGVSMGRGGTDVAKQSSEIILTNNDFASIVHAVKEGRTVYENIKKFLVYILASNTAEALPFIIFIISAGRIPLAIPVLLVLAIDLGTDMVPALALGADPPQPGCMDMPPRNLKEPFFNSYLLFRGLLWLGVMEGVLGMSAYFYFMYSKGQTNILTLPDAGPIYSGAISMAFGAVVLAQVGCVFACRSNTQSFIKTNIFTNRLIWVGIIFELIFLLFTIFVPGFHHVFKTGPIPWFPHIVLLLVCVPIMLIWSDIGLFLSRNICPGAMGLVKKPKVPNSQKN